VKASRAAFHDVRAGYRAQAARILAAVRRVLESGRYILDQEVARFEAEFSRYLGVRYVIGTGSATAALELALRALDVGPGDEVVVPALSAPATAMAVAAVGARPVFADIEPATYTLAPAALERSLSRRTRAVIPVHLYGQCADMAAIGRLAAGIPVIEDAAQAHGARYGGRRVGSLSAAGCFSFYPTKNLGAFGDAGLITTNDDAMAKTTRLVRDHGRTSRYEHAVIGQTARLDTLQAAVLRVQADCLDEWNARRRQVAAWYREMLPAAITCPDDDRGNESVYHQFVVRLRRRDAFRAHLESRGIATAVHYPLPLHLQPALRALGYRAGDFPVTERLTSEVVSLPMHPFLERPQIQCIADAATEFVRP